MRFKKQIEVARPGGDVFDSIADFSNASEWDSGIAEARKVADVAVAGGSEFEVVALFRGKPSPFSMS